ncbi:MAG: prolyl oligopeptidase family serine peptidase [Gemmatimonadota bacterium]
MHAPTRGTISKSHLLLLLLVGLGLPLAPAASVAGQAAAAVQEPELRSSDRFEPADVFQLEWAADPQISPDGSQVVYVRSSNDIMRDRTQAEIWIVRWDGTNHRPVVTGPASYSSPRWSPDGSKLLYVSTDENRKRQLFLRWMDTGETAKLTNLQESPGGLSWSPDGRWIAFSMFVPEETEPFASMPAAPEGAEWAPKPKVYTELFYRGDGQGFFEPGHDHVFVLPAEGGTPRQLTEGPYPHGGTPSWTPDGRHLIISANRRADWQYTPNDSEIYELSVADGAIRPLTDRRGPDDSPRVSPDGSLIAYTGFDDRFQGYQVTKLYVMNRDGSGARIVADGLDRDIGNVQWAGDGRGLLVQYDDEGNTNVALVSLDGGVTDLAGDVGGLSIGRPYAGGDFSVSRDGRIAFTHSTPDYPADLAVVAAGDDPRRLTRLNEDLLSHKTLGEVEEIWYESSHDGRRIQGWVVTPPGFDPDRTYPLLLEIHGGPFANYGDRFSAEVQLYASAGYVVLYTNPRGSTSYGEEFGNLIHHAYPGNDYHDLMSGVDALIARGYVDEDHLFVTGGSGGGVLSSWIVGHTDRFAAAAVQKPVINWYSWVLTADFGGSAVNYWFPAKPWEDPEHYLQRSPIQHVGNVTTPTMLITGEVDYRTPMSESEQFYQALKIRKIPTALVRIPEASHGISNRPSHMIAKVQHILAWFDRYREEEVPAATDQDG